MPKTPLHARLKAAGRLIAESVGDQFVFTNIVPGGMSRIELRAWLTLSMCLETACRRPRAIRQAFTLALMPKHFYEYVRDTSRQLEALIRELRELQPAR